MACFRVAALVTTLRTPGTPACAPAAEGNKGSEFWLSALVFGFGKAVPQSSNRVMPKHDHGALFTSFPMVYGQPDFGKGLAIIRRQ